MDKSNSGAVPKKKEPLAYLRQPFKMTRLVFRSRAQSIETDEEITMINGHFSISPFRFAY